MSSNTNNNNSKIVNLFSSPINKAENLVVSYCVESKLVFVPILDKKLYFEGEIYKVNNKIIEIILSDSINDFCYGTPIIKATLNVKLGTHYLLEDLSFIDDPLLVTITIRFDHHLTKTRILEFNKCLQQLGEHPLFNANFIQYKLMSVLSYTVNTFKKAKSKQEAKL
jgi:hypothetical protein